MRADLYEVQAIRPGAEHDGTWRFERAEALSPMAAAHTRVAASIRLEAAELGQAEPFDLIEASCLLRRDDGTTERRPGIVLLHRRLPISVVMFETTAWIGIGTGLAPGIVAPRLAAVRRILERLDALGFSALNDLQTGSVAPTLVGLSRLLERLNESGGSRHMRRIMRSSTLVAGLLAALLVLGSSLFGQPRLSLPWRVLEVTLLCGAIAAVWIAHRWLKLRGQIARVRRDVICGTDMVDLLVFRFPRHWFYFTPFAAPLVVSWALGAAQEGHRVLAAVLVAVAAVCTAAALYAAWFRVTLDAVGITVRGLRRRRFRYAAIDGMWAGIGSFILESGEVQARLSTSVREFSLLWDELWARVEQACLIDPAVLAPSNVASMLEHIRERLTQVRIRSAWKREDRPADDSIRGWGKVARSQYEMHRHLLREGTIVWGQIVGPQHDRIQPDGLGGVAWVVFSEDPWFDGELDALGTVAGRLDEAIGHDDTIAASPSDPPQELRECAALVGRSDGFVRVDLPPSETFGRRVTCATVMIVARHLPLGYLRSPWVPLLVASAKTPHVMVLPGWYWDEETRRLWKAGASPHP